MSKGDTATERVKVIIAWGDSLTQGRNPVRQVVPYTVFAEKLLGPRVVVKNVGISGETSTEILARLSKSKSSWPRVTWIWVGRNNFGHPEQVRRDIAEMVRILGHDRYLIGGITPADRPTETKGGMNYQVIEDLNASLRAAYGDRYVDIHAALMEDADSSGSERGLIPASLRVDDVHLNEQGNEIVAEAFSRASRALGFVP